MKQEFSLELPLYRKGRCYGVSKLELIRRIIRRKLFSKAGFLRFRWGHDIYTFLIIKCSLHTLINFKGDHHLILSTWRSTAFSLVSNLSKILLLQILLFSTWFQQNLDYIKKQKSNKITLLCVHMAAKKSKLTCE